VLYISSLNLSSAGSGCMEIELPIVINRTKVT
jgi:hypothetical protein